LIKEVRGDHDFKMKKTQVILPENTLWSRTIEQTEFAKNCGALQSIPTEYEIIENNGIPFIVRILTNLIRKEKAKQQKPKDFNPFLPYEKDLFVADISDTHLCLLNKYNVVDHHLLIITREFESQKTLINLADFIALCACLQQIDGLAFYNGGKMAGASVRHKHIQIVPLSLVENQENIPIEIVINDNLKEKISAFNFVHSFEKLEFNWEKTPEKLGKLSFKIYQKLLKKVDIFEKKNGKQSAPYNLLMTRNWLLIVPRSAEKYQTMSINSLGFAGALLVKNEEQLEIIKKEKPLTILEQVSKF
jgi:ATP adenylyltransferase